jgi:hypothetical protein
MAVKTSWNIDFVCGHSAVRDLSGRAADRRAGFAEWLATQDCSVNCTRPRHGSVRSRVSTSLSPSSGRNARRPSA